MGRWRSGVHDGVADWLIVVSCLAAIAMVVVIYAHALGETGLPRDAASWGQFGDYVGGTLNPLFALISVVLLVRTLRATRKDLELSRHVARLAELQKKLDGVLAYWERTLASQQGRADRRELVPLLDELAEFCVEYEDAVGGDRTLTNFYRRRVRDVVDALHAGGALGAATQRHLTLEARG
jgi:hypothetical protein